MSTIPGIIMAGGPDSPGFAAAGEPAQRGLALIEGRPMIGYVVDALRGAPGIGEILVVCRPDFPGIPGVDRVVPAAGDLVANIGAALAACPESEGVLLTTADVPFMTSEAVQDYLERCHASGASFCWAAIRRETNDRRFPGMRRTYSRFVEGEFTGGNAAYLRPSLWPAIEPVLTRAYQARKKPWLLVRYLGPRILWRRLLNRLSIAEAEARVSQVFSGPCRAIITPFAEIGADVDDAADLRLARQLLAPSKLISP